MAQNPHPKTLFHLVPGNAIASDALLHPDNLRFVSRSESGHAGLEVGFHVPSTARGHVITRLGRDADLILRQSTPQQPMSATHVAFEINPATHHVLLSVRSKRLSSVTFSKVTENEEQPVEETIMGDGVIAYSQGYEIRIACYFFTIVWRAAPNKEEDNIEFLKTLAMEGLRSSLRLSQDMRSRDRPTEVDVSEAQSWHLTRLHTAKSPLFQDVEHLRTIRDSGAFGTVYSAIDQVTGYQFAIKVVQLVNYQNGDIETARALLHREIKMMDRVKHKHIIEILGHQRFHTLLPEIFMPLRDGTLSKLARSPSLAISLDHLSLAVLEQILGALDYLANENIIHRDVKPDNILYSDLGGGQYLFQLADFGLAHHQSLATTFCGTGYFIAPELRPQESNIRAIQSPKLDIWSLFATIVAVHSAFKEFPPDTANYIVVLSILKKKGRDSSRLEPMARLHPDRRASAAQMLVRLFNGRGLTTPESQVPCIEPDVEPHAEPVEPEPQAGLQPVAQPRRDSMSDAGAGPGPGPSDLPPTDKPRGKAGRRAIPSPPLIVYPPRKRVPPLKRGDHQFRRPAAVSPRVQPTNATPQIQAIRTHRDGVVKHRSKPPGAKPSMETKGKEKEKLLASGAPSEPVLRMPGMYVD